VDARGDEVELESVARDGSANVSGGPEVQWLTHDDINNARCLARSLGTYSSWCSTYSPDGLIAYRPGAALDRRETRL
jgi:hypothetical protein